jgi:ATP-binding cassette subfamily F protein uup
MVAQRGEGVARRAAVSAAAHAAAGAPSPTSAATQGSRVEPKARLSFKEKHALETLPALIDRLNADIAKLNDLLAEPGLFERNPARFNKAVEALGQTQTKLADSEEEWLRLEMLREAAEG